MFFCRQKYFFVDNTLNLSTIGVIIQLFTKNYSVMKQIIKRLPAIIITILLGVACYLSGTAFLDYDHNEFFLSLHSLLLVGLLWYIPHWIANGKFGTFVLYILEICIALVLVFILGKNELAPLCPIEAMAAGNLLSFDFTLILTFCCVLMVIAAFRDENL